MNRIKLHLYSQIYFEKWSWKNSVEGGIGGSETCAVELARRFARRGYEVVSYSPMPEGDARQWDGVAWKDLEEADFSEPGLWIIFRSALTLDRFSLTNDNQTVWLFLQDESPGGDIIQERADKIDQCIALCQWHKAHLERNWPLLRGKIVVSSNGIKCDLIREVESGRTQPLGNHCDTCDNGCNVPQSGCPDCGYLGWRNPCKLIYASSPDRGLLKLCEIFKRAREYIPELELHCFYGTDNIEKLIDFDPRFKHYKSFLAKLKKAIDQPGITWRGRVGPKELCREIMSAGLWCYPTSFTETSCIVSQEMQAMGAVPITRPLAALEENVRHGVFIQGDPADPLVTARYVAAIVKLASDPELQEKIRAEMMPYARIRFDWERVVDQLEWLVNGWPEDGRSVAQFSFQRRHATGRVLNVGCADDPARFAATGGVNLDANTELKVFGVPMPTAAHVIADARESLPFAPGAFDTVVLGDILEHMTDADAVSTLVNAKEVLADGGRIVITCPEDYREVQSQHAHDFVGYPAGESACHDRPITLDIIAGWLAESGFQSVKHEDINYPWFAGHGVVAVPEKEPALLEAGEILDLIRRESAEFGKSKIPLPPKGRLSFPKVPSC